MEYRCVLCTIRYFQRIYPSLVLCIESVIAWIIMPSTFLDNIKYYSHLIARPPSVVRPTLHSSPYHGHTEISTQRQIEDSDSPQSQLQESSQFLSTKTTASADGDHVTDGGPDIFPHSHNYHVPLFTLSVSILELCVFLYHVIDLHINFNKSETGDGPVPLCSIFIYNPYRRHGDS